MGNKRNLLALVTASALALIGGCKYESQKPLEEEFERVKSVNVSLPGLMEKAYLIDVDGDGLVDAINLNSGSSADYVARGYETRFNHSKGLIKPMDENMRDQSSLVFQYLKGLSFGIARDQYSDSKPKEEEK